MIAVVTKFKTHFMRARGYIILHLPDINVRLRHGKPCAPTLGRKTSADKVTYKPNQNARLIFFFSLEWLSAGKLIEFCEMSIFEMRMHD